MKVSLLLLFLSGILMALGCGEKKALDPEIEQLGRATGPVTPRTNMGGTPMDVQRGDPTESVVYTGEVTETINVPVYTYLKIKVAPNKEIWTAVPSCKVKVGDSIKIRQSLIMKDFTSPSLSRTFDEIVFGVLDQDTPSAEATDGGTPPTQATSMKQQPSANAEKLPPGHPPINNHSDKTALMPTEAKLPPGHPPIE